MPELNDGFKLACPLVAVELGRRGHRVRLQTCQGAEHVHEEPLFVAAGLPLCAPSAPCPMGVVGYTGT